MSRHLVWEAGDMYEVARNSIWRPAHTSIRDVKGRDPTEEQLTIYRRIPLVIIIATSFAHVGVQNQAAGPDY